MLLFWNKARRELAAHFAVKLQLTCCHCSEVPLPTSGSAPAVQ